MAPILLSQVADKSSWFVSLYLVVVWGTILAIVCAIVVGLVALLANSKTRLIGVLLSILLVLPLAALALYVSFIATPSYHAAPAVQVYPSPTTPGVMSRAEPASDRVIVELSTDADDSSGEKKVGSVLRILANAVLKALDEQEQSDRLPGAAESPVLTTVADEPSSSPRPAWVDREPHLVDGIYQMPISIGPYLTLDECQSKLPEELQKAVGEYVRRHLGPQASQRVRLPLDYIEGHLVQAQWEERKQFSVGPMMRLHVLLGFDRQASERIREEWTRLVVQNRIGGLSFLGTALLLLLATVYGYLKADLATEGRYRGRLRLAAGTAVVLLISVVLVIVAK